MSKSLNFVRKLISIEREAIKRLTIVYGSPVGAGRRHNGKEIPLWTGRRVSGFTKNVFLKCLILKIALR